MCQITRTTVCQIMSKTTGTVNRLKEVAQGVYRGSVAFRVGRNLRVVVTRYKAHFVRNRCHTPTYLKDFM